MYIKIYMKLYYLYIVEHKCTGRQNYRNFWRIKPLAVISIFLRNKNINIKREKSKLMPLTSRRQLCSVSCELYAKICHKTCL